MWEIFLLYAVFSLTYPLGKYAMMYTQPIFFVGARMIFAGLVLFAYQKFFTNEKFYVYKEDRKYFFHLTFFAIYLSYCLQYWALPYVPATKWALLYTVCPFITAFFSYVHFAEKMTFKKIVGLLLAAIGLIPALLYSNNHVNTIVCPESLLNFGLPEIAILLSVTVYAYGWVVARKLVKEDRYSSVMINSIPMFFGGILALVTSPLIEQWAGGRPPVTQWQPFMIIVVAIAIFNIFSYVMSTILLKKYTATFLTFMSFVDPLYVALLSWLFLSESITWHFFVAVFLFVIGLFIFYQEELKQGYIVR